MKRGIIIDPKGYFLAAVQWDEKTDTGPNLRNIIPGEVCKMLPETVAEEGMELGRWNEKEKRWEYSKEEVYIVDERGNFRGGLRLWKERLPTLPITQQIVTEPPPRTDHAKAIWDFETKTWTFPKRFKVFDAKDKLINVELGLRKEDIKKPKGGSVEED